MTVPQENRKYRRAKIKWPVIVKHTGGTIEGVTVNVSSTGVYISCAMPLKLNELFDMSIEVPELDHPVEVHAEVIWSNIHGPDDEITPRGMAGRFLTISSADRKAISKAILRHFDLEDIEPDTSTIEVDPGSSGE